MILNFNICKFSFRPIYITVLDISKLSTNVWLASHAFIQWNKLMHPVTLWLCILKYYLAALMHILICLWREKTRFIYTVQYTHIYTRTHTRSFLHFIIFFLSILRIHVLHSSNLQYSKTIHDWYRSIFVQWSLLTLIITFIIYLHTTKHT